MSKVLDARHTPDLYRKD